MKPALSVIISTYERPDALWHALAAVGEAARQLPASMEVVVADDGSGPETRATIAAFADRAPFSVGIAWQEHQGFRLAAIRNRAALQAKGDVLVFIDGDCMLDPPALALHAARTQPGRAHTGSRVFLTEEETQAVLRGALAPARAGSIALYRDHWRLRRLYGANLFYRALRLKPRPKLTAANCAVHRFDFERINGFDERFVGWGFEDDDLARRLRRAGIWISDGTLDCLATHLFHLVHESHRPSSRGTANYRYYHEGRFLTRCRRGLRRLPLETLRFRSVGAPPAMRPLLDILARPPAGVLPAVVPPAAVSRAVVAPASVSPAGEPEEVLLLFSGMPPSGTKRCIELVVPDAVAAAGPDALRKFLEDSL